MIFQSRPLGELCNLTMGRTPPRGNSKFWDTSRLTKNVWISIADMTKSADAVLVDSKEYLSDEGSKSFAKVKAGTLLMSFKLSIGKLAIAGTDLQTNEAIMAMNELDENLILRDYLFYYLYGFDWSHALQGRSKVKGNTLNKKILEGLPVFFPSLGDQREIVEKLDTVFGELDLLEKNLNLIESLINDCDVSILGRTLNSTIGESGGHRVSTLGDTTNLISRGISPTYLDSASTVVLNQRCIRNGRVDLNFSRRHDEQAKKVQEAKLLQDSDGLINSTGVGTLGRTALFDHPGTGQFTVDSHVTIVRPNRGTLHRGYFGLVLKALENVFVSLATGTSGQTELPREAIKETVITFPNNLDEQKDFFEYYSSINSAIGEFREMLDEKRVLYETLRKSLLSSAFTGMEKVA